MVERISKPDNTDCSFSPADKIDKKWSTDLDFFPWANLNFRRASEFRPWISWPFPSPRPNLFQSWQSCLRWLGLGTYFKNNEILNFGGLRKYLNLEEFRTKFCILNEISIKNRRWFKYFSIFLQLLKKIAALFPCYVVVLFARHPLPLAVKILAKPHLQNRSNLKILMFFSMLKTMQIVPISTIFSKFHQNL